MDRDTPTAPAQPAPGLWFLSTFPAMQNQGSSGKPTAPGLGQGGHKVYLNLVNIQHGSPNNKNGRTWQKPAQARRGALWPYLEQ